MNKLTLRILAGFFLTFAGIMIAFMLVLNSQVDSRFTHYLQMNEMHHRMMQRSGPNGNSMMGHGMMGQGNTGMMGQGNASMNEPSPIVMGEAETDFLSTLQQSLLLVGIVGLSAGGILFYWLSRSIARPVVELNQAVHRITRGEQNVTVPITSSDEVGQLAFSFNEMSRALQSSTILRQRFLAGIAHELRTPLTVLKANLEGLADGVITPDQDQFNSLTEEVDRLTDMVSNLRELSLLEAGQLKPNIAPAELSDIVRQTVKQAELLGAEKKLAFSTDIPPSLPAHADKNMVRQILYNLLLNALHYTPAGGQIKVTLAQEAGMAVLTVSDTGIGIAPEELPHIFDYFYRVDADRSRISGGTGLGLALVKQMAAAHKGTVTAESIPHKGSTFTVRFPL